MNKIDLPFSPKISVLNKKHRRKAFSCGKKSLARYLKQQASQDLKQSLSAVFVLEAPNQKDILAFYSLSALSINAGKLSTLEAKKLPNLRPIPCTLLGQFAVDSQWKSKGVGGWLFAHVLHEVLKHSEKVGSFALIVDAVDEDAHSYWKHCSLIPFPSTPNRLFVPMRTIRSWLTH